jgi:hypothetical protein
MQGMKVKLDGDKLIVTIDVSKNAINGAKLSESKKTRVVASSRGPHPIDIGGGAMVKLNANVWTDAP